MMVIREQKPIRRRSKNVTRALIWAGVPGRNPLLDPEWRSSQSAEDLQGPTGSHHPWGNSAKRFAAAQLPVSPAPWIASPNGEIARCL